MGQEKDKSEDKALEVAAINRAPERYIAAKLQKLGNVLYLLTSHFPEDEPLRSEIRRRSLGLLSFSFEALSRGENGKGQNVYKISAALVEIRSFLELSLSAGLLSDANMAVLRHEIDSLISYVESDSVKGAFFVGNEDFSPHENDMKNVLEFQRLRGVQEGSEVLNAASRTGSENQSKTDQKPREDVRPRSVPGSLSKAKKRRRDAILAVLKGGGDVGIKEIAAEVTGCSQKTIQRELSDLVEEGILAKQGDRRWSTYRLVSSPGV